MFELRGRIAFGAVLAVFLAVGLGSGLNAAVPNSSPTSANSAHCWNLAYDTTDGRILSLSSSCSSYIVQQGVGVLNLTSSPVLSIIDTNGWVNAFYVNLTSHQVTLIPGVTFSSTYQQAFYDGQPIINGTLLPNPYTSSTTPVNNVNLCGPQQVGQIDTLLTPLNGPNSANGTVYLREVTDNGTVVNVGVVFVTHRISASDSQGSASYCEYLNGGSTNFNATGFTQMTDHPGDGLPYTPQGGVYNFTVLTTAKNGEVALLATPDVMVQPGAVTYVTISVPSGNVTITVCGQGSSCTTTTTVTSKGS